MNRSWKIDSCNVGLDESKFECMIGCVNIVV